MIGYYVHHRGAGHLHRALAVIAELLEPVTILSSLEPPEQYAGAWMALPLDTDIPPVDPTAGGSVHWAPLASRGLSSRMAAISSWLESALPTTVIVDVSVEVAALVRLHGVPVITFAQPGDRRDEGHTLGYRMASAVIEPWPSGFHPLITDPSVRQFNAVGAISRIPIVECSPVPDRNPRRIAVLNGSGGRGASALDRVVADARQHLPDFEWTILEGNSISEVATALRESAVVFAHCGQNAVAEIAASRIPAILVAEARPHDEQVALAAAICGTSVPAIVVDPEAATEWPELIERANSFDGDRWAWWCDGRAAARVAAIVLGVAGMAAPASGRRSA